MAADGSSNSFKDGRANLRETAKWMVSGTLGAATLIVGSSTISQLGGMETNWRFWVAVASLITAAGLCWIPFARAVAVLRSEINSLQQFINATGGEFMEAADQVSAILGPRLKGRALRDFVRDFETLRQGAWIAAADQAAAEKAVAELDGIFQTCREACVSQLVAGRFDRLVAAIRFPGSVILATFLIFTWAANPPRDIKLFAKPYAETLTPERLARLTAAGVPAACVAPGAQLIAVAAPDAGPQTAVLIPPAGARPPCAPRKVILSAGAIVTAQ